MSFLSTSGSLKFVKMHGAGNDFVILDQRIKQHKLNPSLVRAIADRNRGVGFDQLVEILPGQASDIKLVFWNANGSQSGACGNVTRCVGALLLKKIGDRLKIRTAFGLLEAHRQKTGIYVNMGHPQTDWQDIPLARQVDVDALPLDGKPSAVGIGNPHCIFFVPDAEAVDLARRGAEIENHLLFPQKTNVEFVSPMGEGQMRVRVWERGTGITQACASGACAVAVAAIRRKLASGKVDLMFDGGLLSIEWREDGVWMTGPAAYVFEGELSPEFMGSYE